MKPSRTCLTAPLTACVALAMLLADSCGCTARRTATSELAVRDAVARYRADRGRSSERSSASASPGPAHGALPDALLSLANNRLSDARHNPDWSCPSFTLGVIPEEPTGIQPAASAPAVRADVPADYWKEDVWHQAGSEFNQLATRDFWRGFKTSFWDAENALLLTAAMGASITIRGTGVDDTIRGRVKGHRQLGDMDETIQILGNPGTHFAGAGVLWLASTLAQDAREHEVAKALTQALAVNGVTTLALKAATNTRAPDGENLAWPSGHTSSAFTVAAVLNEYYGPWVGVPSFALAGLVGYQRIDSRVHDFSDVVFGAVLGYAVGTSIARDGKAQFPELFGMKVIPFADPQTGASGLALMKSW